MERAKYNAVTRPTSGPGIVAPATLKHQRICVVLLGALGALSAVASLFHFAALQWIDRWTFLTPSQVPELYVGMWIFGVLAALTAGGALIVHRNASGSPRLARLVLLGGALFGVILTDRGLAIAFPPPSELNSLLEPHPQRGWALRCNAQGTDAGVHARTNSLGLRGAEVSRDKPAEEFRILFVGDSVTFGYDLSESQTLSARCCAALTGRNPRAAIRCINAGVSGYTTWQELQYLDHDGLALRPDMIVLQFSLNDILDVLLVDPGRVHGRRIEFEFSNSSHWSGIVRAIASLRARRYWRQARDNLEWIDENDRATVARLGSFQSMFAEPPPAAVEKAWQRVFTDLTAFDALCKSRGIPWVFIVTPSRSELDPKVAHLRPQKRLRAWADAQQVPMFDPLPLILAHGERRRLSGDAMYIDEGHPTPATMALIAEALANFLVERGLIGPGAATDPAPPR